MIRTLCMYLHRCGIGLGNEEIDQSYMLLPTRIVFCLLSLPAIMRACSFVGYTMLLLLEPTITRRKGSYVSRERL